jgi:hypothetical protein
MVKVVDKVSDDKYFGTEDYLIKRRVHSPYSSSGRFELKGITCLQSA